MWGFAIHCAPLHGAQQHFPATDIYHFKLLCRDFGKADMLSPCLRKWETFMRFGLWAPVWVRPFWRSQAVFRGHRAPAWTLGAMALSGKITTIYVRPYVLNDINILANAAPLQYGAFWMDISTVMHVLYNYTQLEIEKSRGPLVQWAMDTLCFNGFYWNLTSIITNTSILNF